MYLREIALRNITNLCQHNSIDIPTVYKALKLEPCNVLDGLPNTLEVFLFVSKMFGITVNDIFDEALDFRKVELDLSWCRQHDLQENISGRLVVRNIQHIRDALGINNVEFQNVTGVSYRTYSNWVKKTPKIPTVAGVADKLGVTLNYLLSDGDLSVPTKVLKAMEDYYGQKLSEYYVLKKWDYKAFLDVLRESDKHVQVFDKPNSNVIYIATSVLSLNIVSAVFWQYVVGYGTNVRLIVVDNINCVPSDYCRVIV